MEQAALERLGPLTRAAIVNAPFNLGASSVARYRGRYDDAEIAGIVEQFIQDYMHGGESEATRAYWGRMQGRHPQLDKDYPNKAYQLYPTRRANTRTVQLPRWLRRRMKLSSQGGVDTA